MCDEEEVLRRARFKVEERVRLDADTAFAYTKVHDDDITVDGVVTEIDVDGDERVYRVRLDNNHGWDWFFEDELRPIPEAPAAT